MNKKILKHSLYIFLIGLLTVISCKVIFDKALNNKEKTINLEELADTYSHKSNINFKLGKPRKVIKYAKKALEIYREFNYERQIARELGNIGSSYAMLRKYNTALKYINEKLNLCKRLGIIDFYANGIATKGHILSKLGWYNEGRSLLIRAFEIHKKIGQEQAIEIDLNILFHSFMEERNLKKAEQIFKKIIASYPDSPGALYFLGKIYNECGKYKLAGQAFLESNKLRKNK